MAICNKKGRCTIVKGKTCWRNPISCVYMITCIGNGKIYIGSSRTTYDRWRAHCYTLRKNKHENKHLQHAYNLYGFSSFRFSVLLYGKPEELQALEQEQMELHNSTNRSIGFNIAKTTKGAPRVRDKHVEKVAIYTDWEAKPKCRSLEACEATASKKRKTWHFVDPLGNKIMTNNLPAFAKENKLPYKSLLSLQLETLGACKGWRKYTDTRMHVPYVCDRSSNNGVSRRKNYKLICPCGNIIAVTGMKKFCKAHSLNSASVFKMLRGKQEHHKGYRAYTKALEGVVYDGLLVDGNIGASMSFTLVSPDKEIIKILGLSGWCRKNNLSEYSVRRLLTGDILCYKGWTLK